MPHVIKDYVLGFYYHLFIIPIFITLLTIINMAFGVYFFIMEVIMGLDFYIMDYYFIGYLLLSNSFICTRLYSFWFSSFSNNIFSVTFYIFSVTTFGFSFIYSLLIITNIWFSSSLSCLLLFNTHRNSFRNSHKIIYYKFVFWKSIHLEVASGTFCLLVNSPWLLIFSLVIILFIFTGFNIYCWAGIHFSWSNSIIFGYLGFGLIYSFHIWSRDLLRELAKKYEILLMVLFILFAGFLASEALLFVSFFWASFHSLSSPTLGMWPGEAFYLPDPCELTFTNTLLLSNAAVSLGGAFVSLEISSQYYIFMGLWSFCLSSLFISLQIKEFRIMALSINDSLYSCLFFFLTGLHFFHLTIGLLLLSLLFWSCSFSYYLEVPSTTTPKGRQEDKKTRE